MPYLVFVKHTTLHRLQPSYNWCPVFGVDEDGGGEQQKTAPNPNQSALHNHNCSIPQTHTGLDHTGKLADLAAWVNRWQVGCE